MKTFYIVCVCAIIALTIVTINIRREATNFHGIADAKEMVVKAEFGVEIKRVRITPGQLVSAGDTLIELTSPQIDLKISEFSHLINEIKTRSKAQANLSKSEMRQLKTEHESRINEIRSELQQLQSQYEINRRMMKQLRSIEMDGSSDGTGQSNPTIIKIQNLKTELTRLENSNAIMDDNLHSQISLGVDPLMEQLKQYEDLLRLYTEQRDNLVIIAPSDGAIGTINYNKGEMVSAFDSIATISSISPSFVLGYIHENMYSSVSIGQKVIVRSMADKDNQVYGEIIGVGTRIVEYPVRLRKVQDLQMWGREVTVKIPSDNHFLLGEKVIIYVDEPGQFFRSLAGLSSPISNQISQNDSTMSVPTSVICNITGPDSLKSAAEKEAATMQ